jgi:predicted phosphodiesterase
MKIAFISDIHGNLEALEAVMRDIDKRGAEKIHFLGDVVGYGSNPNECVKMISKYCDLRIMGNHDFVAMGLESVDNFNQLAQASINWTMEKITSKTIETMADFEMSAEFLDYYLVHGSPSQPEEWHYILTASQAASQFDSFNQTICLVGHSHIPVIFARDRNGEVIKLNQPSLECAPDFRYIVNVGSVGQPRDNDPRASYVIADSSHNKIENIRIEYDIKKTQEKMKKAKLPDFLIERLAAGL